MTIEELKNTYTNGELTSSEGNMQFKHKVLSPLFKNLYENKIVIHDRITCIAELEKIEILPDYFSAFVKPKIFIPTGTPSDRHQEKIFEKMKKGWTAGCKWEYMRIIGTSLCSSPYAAWSIWVDAKKVQRVENLVNDGKYPEALNLTHYENN